MTEKTQFDSPQREETLLLSRRRMPPGENIQSQMGKEGPSLDLYDRRVDLTTHLHVVPMLNLAKLYFHYHMCLHGQHSHTFLFT
jgi:hypothetical protein